MPNPEPYPEHMKLHKIHELSQQLGEFLDWLGSHGYQICTVTEDRPGYHPVHKSIQQWLADFYGIDLRAIDREKKAMLDEIRKAQAGTTERKTP